MHITLVRHGETEWNRTGRAQGHQQISLNETGRSQAEKVAERLKNESFDRVWSSDLLRAYETIEPWAKAEGVTVIPRRDLRERSFGDWEGDNYHDVLSRLAQRAVETGKHESEIRPPNGESYADVCLRLRPLVDEIRSQEGRLLIVSHGGTLGCLMASLFRADHQTAMSFRFRNGAVAEIMQRPNGDFALERYNDVSHL
jgi:broad specificity phosphatase PhoE